MEYQRRQPSLGQVLELAGRQHGVVARSQLLRLGVTPQGIKRRLESGRLHRVLRGVYAVGRPRISRHGRWMAAVLRCGTDAVLSHRSAAALWGLAAEPPRMVDVSVSARIRRRSPGIAAHRRRSLTADDVTTHRGIPVTTPICTLIDIATGLTPSQLEAAINEADKRDLTDPEQLRAHLAPGPSRPGVRALREILDPGTFVLSDSELERRFRPIAQEVGLSLPRTGQHVNGFKVDFYWPGLGLVVETDGLRYHRTPAQQGRDRLRDQAHTAAGLTCLRFTYAQVRFEPEHVRATLEATARRLGAA
ncbi:MAG: type IV toxin-antitoxin system AbiEi family antitoxin domain-containing protein [Solirubrobacterales bacterium]